MGSENLSWSRRIWFQDRFLFLWKVERHVLLFDYCSDFLVAFLLASVWTGHSTAHCLWRVWYLTGDFHSAVNQVENEQDWSRLESMEGDGTLVSWFLVTDSHQHAEGKWAGPSHPYWASNGWNLPCAYAEAIKTKSNGSFYLEVVMIQPCRYCGT